MNSVAVSPDGRNVYTVGSALAIFSRDPATGALTQLPGLSGCIDSGQLSEPCATASELLLPLAVAVSPDGQNVYVGSAPGDRGALTAFARDPATGALTHLPGKTGCFAQGLPDVPCTATKALAGPSAIAISPKGDNVYVTFAQYAGEGGVAAFSRNATTGVLTRLTGKAACVTSYPSSFGCARGRALVTASSIAMSSDGKTVYVASPHYRRGGIAVFSRDAAGGALHQLPGEQGCFGPTRYGCAPIRGILLPVPGTDNSGARYGYGVAVSPDSKNVYAAGDAIAVFSRKR